MNSVWTCRSCGADHDIRDRASEPPSVMCRVCNETACESCAKDCACCKTVVCPNCAVQQPKHVLCLWCYLRDAEQDYEEANAERYANEQEAAMRRCLGADLLEEWRESE